jgi:hypothetical protein
VAGQRFCSAPSECRGVAIGGTQCSSLGILWKEKGPGWAGARPQRPGGPDRSGVLKRVDGP